MPKSDLKIRLTLRIAVLAAFCFVAGAAYLLIDADRSARARLDHAAGLAANSLELQQSKLEWIRVLMTPFPDLQNAASVVMEPGLCLGYRPTGGDLLQRICSGTEGSSGIPSAFAALYRTLFGPSWEVTRPVRVHGRVIGETVATLDEAMIVAKVWHALAPLLAVMLATLLLLCVLVYAALTRALLPTRLIRVGLERIAANDLSTRLPQFDLAELSAVRDVFNRLAEDLERTVAERNALTHRLISVQDEERKRRETVAELGRPSDQGQRHDGRGHDREEDGGPTEDRAVRDVSCREEAPMLDGEDLGTNVHGHLALWLFLLVHATGMRRTGEAWLEPATTTRDHAPVGIDEKHDDHERHRCADEQAHR